MEPLITVIIPAYNLDEYIERCLKSIAMQTYKNFEVITIDDGSSDNTAQLIERFVLSDNRFKLISGKHKGVSEARNLGLLNANGDYISFADGDDYIETDMFQNFVDILNNDNANGKELPKVVVFGTKDIDENGNILAVSDRIGILEFNSSEFLINILSGTLFYNVCWGRFFDRKVIDDVMFDSSLSIDEDLEWQYQIAGNDFRGYFDSRPEYAWMKRTNSTIGSMDLKKYRKRFTLFDKIIVENSQNEVVRKTAIIRYTREASNFLSIAHQKKDKYYRIVGKKLLRKYLRQYMGYTDVPVMMRLKKLIKVMVY